MTVRPDPSAETSDNDGAEAEATVRMPRPSLPSQPPSAETPPGDLDTNLDDENFDADSTLVREDWESTVIRRVAPHVVAVQSQVAEDSAGEGRFGWESEGLRRLAHEVQKSGN